MIVDSSALVAVALGEADAEQFRDVLEYGDDLKMSAATYVETAIVLDQCRPGSLDRLTNGLDIQIFPVDAQQAAIAREAYRRFGRGSGHAAALNFGDCFSYALSKVTGEPLVHKGHDFTATDIDCVDV